MRRILVFFVLMLTTSMCVNAQDFDVSDYVNYMRDANMSEEAQSVMWEGLGGMTHRQANKTFAAGKSLSQSGYAVGDYFLGWCYEAGEGGATVDAKESVRYFMKATNASVPFPLAYQALGIHYSYGAGVNKDDTKAFLCYEKGAETISSEVLKGECLCSMAVAYQYGEGVSQDMEHACRLYEKAAKLGNSRAMRNLSNCYSSGDGVTKDYAKAFYWQEQAGLAGDADYLFLSALTYLTGQYVFDETKKQSVTIDKQKGINYLKQAASMGSTDAVQALREISK